MNKVKHHNILCIFFTFLPQMDWLIFILHKPNTTRKMARRSLELWIIHFFWAIGRLPFQDHATQKYSSASIFIFSKFPSTPLTLSARTAVIINLCHYTRIHVRLAAFDKGKAMNHLNELGEKMYCHFQCCHWHINLLPFRLSGEPNSRQILMQSSKRNVVEQKKSPEISSTTDQLMSSKVKRRKRERHRDRARKKNVNLTRQMASCCVYSYSYCYIFSPFPPVISN